MSDPERQLRVTPASVRVTRMGFVLDDKSDEQSDEVEYTKVEAANLGVFAVRLVTFPVTALLPPGQLRPGI
jgi:hypothetical protein